MLERKILSPFRNITAEKMKESSFLEKLKSTFGVFTGWYPFTEESKKQAVDSHLGMLDYLGPAFIKWAYWRRKRAQYEIVGDENITSKQDKVDKTPDWQIYLLYGVLIFFSPLIFLGILLSPILIVLNVFLALLLTIAVSPIVAVVHAIWGPKEYKTPIRRSFFLHPATWIMGTFLAYGISLLIQGLSSETFAQVAAPLFIIQSVFTLIAGVMAAGAIAYLAYRTWHYFYRNYSDSEEAQNMKVNEYNGYHAPEHASLIYKYVSENVLWIKNHQVVGALFIAVSVVSVLTALVLIIGYFTDGFGFSPGSFSFMAPVFDFMINGFLAGLHAAAALPGLEFLASASDASLLLGAQIISGILFILTPLILAITADRLINSVLDEPIPELKNRPYSEKTKEYTGPVSVTLQSDCQIKSAQKIGLIYSAREGITLNVTGEDQNGDTLVVSDIYEGWIDAKNVTIAAATTDKPNLYAKECSVFNRADEPKDEGCSLSAWLGLGLNK